jgi:protein TonB
MLSIQKSNVSGKVRLFFTLPLMALLIILIGAINGSISFASSGGHQDKKEKIYTKCDQMPMFPGGDELYKFIPANIVYPEAAKKTGVVGTVFVQFVVAKDGSITQVAVVKGIGSGCDEEAVRVIKMMPKWSPGKEKGKPVNVKIVIPISFKLS